MRKITQKIVGAFISRRSLSSGNTRTNGQSLFLHDNEIARWTNNKLEISNGGWPSDTTKERLNALPGVSINQSNFVWFLNGQKWDGNWTVI
jgi:hypothetical protein